MVEGAAELEVFRRRWRAELARSRRSSSDACSGRKRRRPQPEAEGAAPEPVQGWGGFGGIPCGDPGAEPCRRPSSPSPVAPEPLPTPGPDSTSEIPGGGKEDFLGQLIRDLV